MPPSEHLPIGHMKPIVCQGCGTEQDGYTSTRAEQVERPSPGDALVCFYCAAVNVIQEDGSVTMMTTSEVNELMKDDDELRRIVRGLRLYRAVYGRRS